MSEDYLKQVIVARKDLSMPQGKLAAMAAHASMSFITAQIAEADKLAQSREDRVHFPRDWHTFDPGLENAIFQMRLRFTLKQWRWLTELDPGLEHLGQVSYAKIVVAVNDEAELMGVYNAARAAKVEAHLVVDSGFSHNPPNTVTCCALGPDWPKALDPITGHLKVYR